jgi:hypothetical protein
MTSNRSPRVVDIAVAGPEHDPHPRRYIGLGAGEGEVATICCMLRLHVSRSAEHVTLLGTHQAKRGPLSALVHQSPAM